MNKNNSLSLFIFSLLFSLSCKSNVNKTNIESQIQTITIDSKYLNEERSITIYTPSQYDQTKKYPVVFATDGQLIKDSYKDEIDSLIINQLVKDFILVAVHSNENKVENSDFEYRNYEYLKDWSDDPNSELGKRYKQHYNFFTLEVLNYIESNFSISKNRSNRIFYGFSNGAGLGVSIAAEDPSIFGKYICLSMAGGNYENNKWNKESYPYFHLAYGKDEPFPFVMATDEFDSYLTTNEYDHNLQKWNGGHKRELWKK